MADEYIRIPPDGAGKRTHAASYTTSSGTAIYRPIYLLGDEENPTYTQRIDKKGQAFFRYAEGEQQFTASGSAEVAQNVVTYEYSPEYDDLPNDFGDDVAGTSTIEKHTYLKNVVMTTGTTISDSAIRTSHTYAKSAIGSNLFITFHMEMGDTGKENLVRRWGYFDTSTGAYFSLESLVKYIGIRYVDGSGIIHDDKYGQAEWTEDALDGTGISGYDLNADGYPVRWWISLEYGGGKIRFGIYDTDGDRILVHTYKNYTGPTSLPLRFEQYNTDTTLSISQMYVGTCSIQTNAHIEPRGRVFASDPGAAVTIPCGVTVPFMSIKMLSTYKSRTNRMIACPRSLSFYSSSSACMFKVIKNATIMLGATWAYNTDDESSMIGDATTMLTSGGSVVAEFLVSSSGIVNLDLTPYFTWNKEYLRLHANATDSDYYTLVVRGLNSLGTYTNVFLSLIWEEIT